MIPIQLRISGFLSYQKPVELDFTSFNLACIAGPNGAGKSSLLDAMTWCIFGQARKRDDSLINAQTDVAEVSLVFYYEGNIYRIQRTKPRDKTGMLEFHILQEGAPSYPDPYLLADVRDWIQENGSWKPLTERSLRETEDCIERVLRMDYETFVNASFFLQGKADQFTQQRPGDRKRILSSILGLEVWDIYRQRTTERRKGIEVEIARLDARVGEIQQELDEEETRKTLLETLETELKSLSQARSLQETALDTIRKVAATLAEQRRMVEAFRRQLETTTHRLQELEIRLASRQQERQEHARLLDRAQDIESAYQAWQAVRAELEVWEKTAEQFREQDKRREAPLGEINTDRARLEEQLRLLLDQNAVIGTVQKEAPVLDEQIQGVRKQIEQVEARLRRRVELDQELQLARQGQAEARAENPRLKAEMEELRERINQLKAAGGAACPVCGQPLSPEERERLIQTLEAQGKEMGDRYRRNTTELGKLESQVRALEGEVSSLAEVENELRVHTRTLDQYTDRFDIVQRMIVDWQKEDAPRLAAIEKALKEETYAVEARARLAEIDAGLLEIGYDAAAHDQARRREVEGRAAEAEIRALEMARAALAPLDREIRDLHDQIEVLRQDVSRQQEEHKRAAEALAEGEAQAPDLEAAEAELYALKEQENRLRMDVGAARQKVTVLDVLKTRLKLLQGQRDEQTRQVGYYKQLEYAFGKNGVPALLIEQALPEIEAKSNEILARLSGGNMSVRFVTQTAYKDKKRDDFRETLDIQISDSVGTRDYEMFSGGEAFRVNFAIRLALSEVLAQRAGARLQTLVIDEGFGSQDNLGRQRLIEAINLVKQDFAKVLVITHIDELKDAFPNRIEVEKTLHGSTVTVI